jgi:hypothetical protein
MKISLSRLLVSLVITFLVAILTSNASQALVPLDIDALKIEKPLLKIDPWALKCGGIKSKAESKITKFGENKNKHYEVYIKLADRLEEKITKWKEMGYDVSNLEDDLDAINGKIDKYDADYKIYTDKLEAIKAINCGNTQTDLTNALKEARNALKEVRSDVVDIKTFYWNTVRQHIIDLKSQIISSTEEE